MSEKDGHENASGARVSSPAATGGAGTSFEQHVAAYWLAQLLVRGILGWHTDDNLSLVATAHDVLEDWAILLWLEEQHLTAAAFKDLSSAIGAHPAVRRSYRKWVADLVERDAPAADRLFRAAMSETDISVQFRDDTLVSLLKAPMAPGFLVRHETELLANDRAILKRAIHLLRVACVKTPEWLAGVTEQGSILNVPDGSAWATVLMLVYRNLASFTHQDRGLLLGLEALLVLLSVRDSSKSIGAAWRASNRCPACLG